MLEATTILEDQAHTSDFSPSSEGVAEEHSPPSYPDSLGSGEEEEQEEEEEHSDLGETDSLDEGLGDISSENEAAESPAPAEEVRTPEQPQGQEEGLESPRRMVLDLQLSPGKRQESRRMVLDLELCPAKVAPSSPVKSPDDRMPKRIMLPST